MAKKISKITTPFTDIYKPVVVETFKHIGNYEIGNLTRGSNEPSAFNGIVEVRKYRVTIELIYEPKEIISERLQHLWDMCDNWHHWQPLRNAAAEIGYELIGNAGSKFKNNKS